MPPLPHSIHHFIIICLRTHTRFSPEITTTKSNPTKQCMSLVSFLSHAKIPADLSVSTYFFVSIITQLTKVTPTSPQQYFCATTTTSTFPPNNSTKLQKPVILLHQNHQLPSPTKSVVFLPSSNQTKIHNSTPRVSTINKNQPTNHPPLLLQLLQIPTHPKFTPTPSNQPQPTVNLVRLFCLCYRM